MQQLGKWICNLCVCVCVCVRLFMCLFVCLCVVILPWSDVSLRGIGHVIFTIVFYCLKVVECRDEISFPPYLWYHIPHKVKSLIMAARQDEQIRQYNTSSGKSTTRKIIRRYDNITDG